jgi:hypothetical protein
MLSFYFVTEIYHDYRMSQLQFQFNNRNYITFRHTHNFHVKLVHCHHGMARPRVADRGDGLQILRVAANIVNKQSQTADSGWSSSLGVGRGANNPPP